MYVLTVKERGYEFERARRDIWRRWREEKEGKNNVIIISNKKNNFKAI